MELLLDDQIDCANRLPYLWKGIESLDFENFDIGELNNPDFLSKFKYLIECQWENTNSEYSDESI